MGAFVLGIIVIAILIAIILFLYYFPLGLWIGTSFLDLLGGPEHEGSADALLLGGIVAALPTMASGACDWLSAGSRARRVGVVHAASNSVAWLLYCSSLVSRRRGRRRRGLVLAVCAGVMANVGGYLGGHMSLVLGVPARQRCRA